MNEIILMPFTIAVCMGFGTTLLAMFSETARAKTGLTIQKARWFSVFLFCLVFIALWYQTPTRLGEFVFIERDIPNRNATIHTSSSCPKIEKAYSVNETSYYTYTPYFDRFCKRCFYESDVIKLTKGENKMPRTKELGL